MPEVTPECRLTAGPMVPEAWTVVDRWRETEDTFSFALRPPVGWSFAPGQFNMLYSFGRGESAISISGASEKSGTIIHTIRRVGTVTNALAELSPGDGIGVRGPFGTAWPIDEAKGRDLVLVAGGIGLAPLRPTVMAALENRKEFRRVILLVGARSPADMLYPDQLRQWQDEIEVVRTVDHATRDWDAHVGVVTTRLNTVGLDPGNTVAMTCGPEIMMRFTVAELQKIGVPDQQIYVSMERNMKCAVGFCGHCQYGPEFVCKDGPVFRYDRIARWFNLREF